MIYKEIFELVGTDQQKAIVKGALDKLFFPWERIKTPVAGRLFQIGWADLNRVMEGAKLHQGDHPNTDPDTDRITGNVDGRKYTLGVFYIRSGNIYLENMLTAYPTVAQTTVSAEIAHLLDYFLPLTNDQRKRINVLMHDGDETEHGHQIWWEKANYGSEYFDLVGESFMQAFTLAYSDMKFDHSGFTHFIRPDQVPALRDIIGIQRSDYAPPAPIPAPLPEPTPKEQAPSAEPEPIPEKVFKRLPPSNVYHTLTHYPKKPGTQITDVTEFTPCKTCKPNQP